MKTQSKKHEKRRYILIILLLIAIAFIVSGTFLMAFQLPIPKELDKKQYINLLNNSINSNKPLIIIPDSDFISIIRDLSHKQFHFFQDTCEYSDVLRPLTHKCKNFTGTSETTLSYLAVNQIFQQQKGKEKDNFALELIEKINTIKLKEKVGVEIGRFCDFVIAPLISAYYISKNEIYINSAISLSKEIMKFLSQENPIPAPFIGYDRHHQHFGISEVYIDDVSSVFPVLASLAYITKNSLFVNPVQNFVSYIRKSINSSSKKKKKKKKAKKDAVIDYDNYSIIEDYNNEKFFVPIKYSFEDERIGIFTSYFDFPYKLISDLGRISRILPEIKTDDIIQIGLNRLNKENPTIVYDENYVKVTSIEPCWFASILPKDDPLYFVIVKKCISMIKRKPTPSRMSGKSEFGDYGLLTHFEFDGEMLEILWRNESISDAKKLILNAIKECTTDDGYITGLRNTTLNGKISDNFLHPQFFSRWILNAALIEAGIKYDDVVLSDNGNILKM